MNQDSTSQSHSIPAIRRLLLAVFNDEEFSIFCFDNFRPTYSKFAESMSLQKKVQFLIEHCEQNYLFDKLLELVRESNPKRYQEYLIQTTTDIEDSNNNDEREKSHEKKTTHPVHNLGNRPDLIGRDKDIDDILATLNEFKVTLIIDGRAGIGKTALAVEIAYRCANITFYEAEEWPHRNLIFDYILYFTSRQSELRIEKILDDIGRWTENIYIVQQPSIELKYVETLKILANARSMIVIDNYETITDQKIHEFVLDVPYPSRVLITSREHHHFLRGVKHVPLGEISPEASNKLIDRELNILNRHLSHDYSAILRNQAPEMLKALQEYTRGTPLAIQWAVGQLKDQVLESVINELSHASGDLFEAMFERAWSQLGNSERDVLFILTLFAAPPNQNALEQCTKWTPKQTIRSLQTLSAYRLVELNQQIFLSKSRYSLHPLTRSFVASKLPPEKDVEYKAQIINHFLGIVNEFGGRDWNDPLRFQTLDEDRDNIFQAFNWAYDTKQWKAVITYGEQLRNYTLIYGYWAQRIQQCEKSAEAALQLEELAKHGRFNRHIGWTMILQGRLDEAYSYLRKAFQVAENNNDLKGLADASGDLAEHARLSGDLKTARILRTKALEISVQNGNSRDIYVESTLLAQLDLQENNIEKAQEEFEASLNSATQLGWHRAIAYCLHWLGDIQRLQRNFSKALDFYNQSKSYLESFQDKSRLAMLDKSLAFLAYDQNDFHLAKNIGLQALSDLRRLGLRYEIPELEALLDKLK